MTSSDLAKVLSRVVGSAGRSVEFTIPMKPVPASRPRVSRWGTYYGKTYEGWRKAAAAHVPEVTPPFTGRLAALLVYVLPPFKSVDREWPKGDVDNYAKAILDAVTSTQRVWTDDDQVCLTVEYKRFTTTSEDPHTFVHIREM